MKYCNVVLLVLGAAAMLSVKACPDQCTCSSTDTGYNVDCSSSDLDSIPSSIPSNATRLNLSNNSIQSIGKPAPAEYFTIFKNLIQVLRF